jgi:hypothetical protein
MHDIQSTNGIISFSKSGSILVLKNGSIAPMGNHTIKIFFGTELSLTIEKSLVTDKQEIM